MNAHKVQRTTFESSLTDPEPPAEASVVIQGLWWIKNNNWQKAHDLIDQAPGADAAWVHALLHRMEGDRANAAYWYARAGRERTDLTIGQELEEMIDHFLG